MRVFRLGSRESDENPLRGGSPAGLRSGLLLGAFALITSGCASGPFGSWTGATPAWKSPPPAPAEGPIVPEDALHRATLPNGVTILVLEDDRLPRVALGLEVSRGAGSVAPGQAGLAAISAEVMQRGAGDRDGFELAEVVEDAGASLSVSAGWDSTSIALAGLSEDRALLMEILADVALRPRFEQAEFEKAVAEHEAGLVAAQDDPGTLVRWHALRALFERHRYGLPSAGSPETVASLTVDDARSYWVDRFVPRSTFFWAVGDIDAEALIAEAERLFGGLADTPPIPGTPAVAERTPAARRVIVVDKPDLGQARIIVAHEGISRTEPERIPIDLMNDVLGGSGFSSRLMRRVRSDEGLTYGVNSGFSLRSVAGPFSISTFTRKEKVREVVDLLLAEMQAIQGDRPVTEEEFRKFVSYNVGRFGLSLETSESVLASLVDLEVHGLPEDSLDTFRSRVRDLTLEEVRSAARERLHPDRAAIVILGPASDIEPMLDGLGVEAVEIWAP